MLLYFYYCDLGLMLQQTMLPERRAGIPRIGLFSWLFRSYTWPHNFKVGQPFLLLGKGNVEIDTQNTDKTETAVWSKQETVLCAVTWPMHWSNAALLAWFYHRALQPDQPGWRFRLSCGTGIQVSFQFKTSSFNLWKQEWKSTLKQSLQLWN